MPWWHETGGVRIVAVLYPVFLAFVGLWPVITHLFRGGAPVPYYCMIYSVENRKWLPFREDTVPIRSLVGVDTV